MSATMVLHAGRRVQRPSGIRATTLCGRMNARSQDGMNIAGDGQAVTCKFCLAKARPVLPTLTNATGPTQAVPMRIERATPLVLLQAIYRHHGWKRAEGESMVDRVNAMYVITAEPHRNRFLATPKQKLTIPEPSHL
jgi:hypothetical protein